MVTVTTARSEQDLTGIRELQRRNLRTVLTADAMESQGFLTIEHDLSLLQRMNAAEPAVIARDGQTVAGYCLAMLPSFRYEIPGLVLMFDMLDGLSFDSRPLRERNYVVVGQVCVSEEYRGMGLFDRMYAHFRDTLQPRYELSVTEIAVRNRRSRRAHERVGFQKIHTYFDPANGEDWDVVVWDWGQTSSV
ncbi:GNAT family N-acetyltransferase [Larkinella soli]|uniref:GNAT family N-acetyltransferase n=1 Tax=Larkinella soli TaxID=1770527 RepID=UPI000FFB15EA|nr:GNAT family N-acetyltransferase [Larkinella soli]